MQYPIYGAITPDAMRGIYLTERPKNLELFLHFLMQRTTDRLFSLGEMDKRNFREGLDWTRRVNQRYRR